MTNEEKMTTGGRRRPAPQPCRGRYIGGGIAALPAAIRGAIHRTAPICAPVLRGRKPAAIGGAPPGAAPYVAPGAAAGVSAATGWSAWGCGGCAAPMCRPARWPGVPAAPLPSLAYGRPGCLGVPCRPCPGVPDGREELPLYRRPRDLVVLLFVSERSRHAAASSVGVHHLASGDPGEALLGVAEADQRLLVAVTM